MAKKVKLQVWIPEPLYEGLLQLIAGKYGEDMYRGLLSYEVALALKNWIALHAQAQKPSTVVKPNPTPKVYAVWEQVKDYLLKNYYLDLKPTQQVNYLHLVEAVKAVRGHDERTVKKWLGEFEKFRLIKHLTGAIWEII